MAIIYHLARRSEWEEAGTSGPYRAGSLAEEGFIHCSRDEEQMLGVANRLFAGMEVFWCWMLNIVGTSANCAGKTSRSLGKLTAWLQLPGSGSCLRLNHLSGK